MLEAAGRRRGASIIYTLLGALVVRTVGRRVGASVTELFEELLELFAVDTTSQRAC